LGEEESRHLIRVLRLKKGDPVEFVDGLGNRYTSVISDPDPSNTELRIAETKIEYLKRDFSLHLGIAPTKSNVRFEWFLEKATEIGIEEVTPLICDHSERNRLRMDRSERILVAAMKQSGRAYLPKLNPATNFAEFIENAVADVKYIAHCREALGELPGSPQEKSMSWLVLIGPEGDFSASEVEMAKKSNFQEISLGEAVYRAETAGIIACQLISFLHREM